MAVVAAGYAKEVVSLAGLLEADARRAPKIQLVRCYATYYLGRYDMALGHAAEAALNPDGLSPQDLELLEFLRDACEYRTGRIDEGEYERRRAEGARREDSFLATTLILERLRDSVFAEQDEANRRSMIEQARRLVERVQANADCSEGFKLSARIDLLNLDGFQAWFQYVKLVGTELMRRRFWGPSQDDGAAKELEDAARAIAQWDQVAMAIVNDARNLRHPVLFADALSAHLCTQVGLVRNMRSLSLAAKASPSPMPASVADALRQEAQQAITMYQQADMLEGELKAKLMMGAIPSTWRSPWWLFITNLPERRRPWRRAGTFSLSRTIPISPGTKLGITSGGGRMLTLSKSQRSTYAVSEPMFRTHCFAPLPGWMPLGTSFCFLS